MAKFDENGVQTDAYTSNQAEQDALWALLQVVPEPDNGYALSQLRAPGSKKSLAAVEKDAAALVQSGRLTRRLVQNGKGTGGYYLYSKVVS